MAVKPGLSIARATHRFRPERSDQLIALAKTELILDEAALVVQSAAAGRVIVDDNVSGKELTLSPNQSIFQYQNRIDFSRLHDASQANDLSFLIISESVLYNFLGEGSARELMKVQKLMDASTARGVSIPHDISSVLHSSMTPHLTGDFRKLYAQGKILKYLSLLSNFSIGERGPTSSPRRTKLIRQVHEELLNLQGEVPTLSDLSKKCGLSARTLNNDFKKEFGESLYAYIKDQRLAQAHAALAETDTPIKVIAARVGYAHVTNFMLAFKKKYGYSAGSLRR